MTRRLAKEFRSLLLPWLVALVAGGLMGFPVVLNDSFWDSQSAAIQLFFFLFKMAPLTFCAGMIIMAGLSFGTEFQQRTFPLLLSQPIHRSRMWNEKMIALGSAFGSF